MKKSHLFIAIPAMDELDFLPRTLHAIKDQITECSFTVFVCVNQPDGWWDFPEKRVICDRNSELLSFLKEYEALKLHVLDCSSKGRGWKGKNYGVGWARKVLFDSILSIANPDDILISLDADTLIEPHYFQSVFDNFQHNPNHVAISMPYYHKLTQDEITDRAILRYELYMRNWFLNMYRINSPYTFTAIGSAIAINISSLSKIGGITPSKSGEDFYLLQKLRKMGLVNNWNAETVYPAARFSDRVFFGTGPAMIKGAKGDWKSYPIYHYTSFDKIKKAYDQLVSLFENDIENEFLYFLGEQFNDQDLWNPLRKNHKEFFRFERAFHEKADGLRILQFMKCDHEKYFISDEEALLENLGVFFPHETPLFLQEGFSIDTLSIKQLNLVRNMLFRLELQVRREMLKSQGNENG